LDIKAPATIVIGPVAAFDLTGTVADAARISGEH
jgi:hypothetical protein